MYVQIHEAFLKMDTRPNYMNVSAAIKELEKIEMIRRTDGVYRLDHAVTAVQKKILGASGLTAQNVLYRADEISTQLKTIRDKEKCWGKHYGKKTHLTGLEAIKLEIEKAE